MLKLYCSKCKEFKDIYMFANSYNSTKFCTDCGTVLNLKEYKEPEKSENPYAFIDIVITNTLSKMFKED